MNKHEQLEKDLQILCETRTRPVLAWSGGKDSQLILYFLKKLGYNIPVLVFQNLWSGYQKKFIASQIEKFNLTAFFYRPNRLEKINDSILSYYQIGEQELTVIADIVADDSRCGVELGHKALPNELIPPFLWDTLITGSKKTDRHPLNPKPIESFSTERIKVVTPLWEWSDTEVFDAIALYDISIDERFYRFQDEKADTGNVHACFNCVNTTEKVFCPKENKEILGWHPINKETKSRLG